jgi:ankyrin repeat protein
MKKIMFAFVVLGAWLMAGSDFAFGGEIHDAAESGGLEKVRLLLKANPELVFSKDTDGRTPLHYAASCTNKDVVELLLAYKADVNAKDNDGRTPLHLASEDGRKEVVELLLANHADVNAKDGYGDTPLHWVADWGRKDLVKLLLASKADINAKDNRGYTPLQCALHSDQGAHKDVVKILRQNGGKE